MTYKEIFSVTQLTTAIKQKIEGSFPSVAVRGEVSNLRKQASGHIYFTLKDASAQLSAVLFRGNASRLAKEPKEGDQIIAYGELSVYPPRGNYQMIVRSLEFSGVGELLKKLHDLKIKLEAMGWFSQETKKPLPHLPKKIGVVTSPTGSVIQDILHVLERRFSGFHLVLNPVRVQGEGAAAEIAKAIGEMDRHKACDVLIVGRGGGSLEDLWPFNEEIVARAIHNCQIPVVSAVGHETDYTLADFVADVRAPTPSAAAEIVMGEKAQLLASLAKTRVQIAQLLKGHLNTSRAGLQSIARHPMMSSADALLGVYFQKIDDACDDLNTSVQMRLRESQLKLEGLEKQKEALNPMNQLTMQRKAFVRSHRDLSQLLLKQIAGRREKLRRLKEHLEAIDPRNLLKKGYSIVFSEKNDSVILRAQDVTVGDGLRIQVSDGNIHVKVGEPS